MPLRIIWDAFVHQEIPFGVKIVKLENSGFQLLDTGYTAGQRGYTVRVKNLNEAKSRPQLFQVRYSEASSMTYILLQGENIAIDLSEKIEPIIP